MFSDYIEATKAYLSQGSRVQTFYSQATGTSTRTITESKYEYRGMTEAGAKTGEATLNTISGTDAMAEADRGPMWKISVTETTYGAWPE